MSFPHYPQNGPDGTASTYPAPQPYVPGYGDNTLAPPSRPGTVLAGCIMTWIGGAFGIFIGLVMVAASNDQTFREQVGLDPNAADLVAILGLAFLTWSVLAVILGVFTFLGRRWAAITLLTMAGIYTAVTIVGLSQSGQTSGLFGPVYSIAASALIFGGSKTWFASKRNPDRMVSQ